MLQCKESDTTKQLHFSNAWVISLFFNSLKYIYQGMGLMDHIINPILIFLSPCLFNLYAEYIMRNAGLDEAQAGIKITGRNINNFREADDTGSQIV